VVSTGKARGERIEEGKHVVAEGKPEQHESDNGIEEAEEDHVARHGEEIDGGASRGDRGTHS
jgi:hypothetical protein